ncbi:MAG: FAD-binding oxidoreductase [Vampirovibrionales bacterium]
MPCSSSTALQPSNLMVDTSVTVQAHVPLGNDQYRLVLQATQPLPTLVAGQFFMLSMPYAEGFLFRRPFSAFTLSEDGRGMTLVYKVVGEGTQALATAKVGDTLQLLTPLGQPFPSGCTAQETLLISGGIGVAPMMLQVQQWQQQGQQGAGFLFGCRSQSELALIQPEQDTLLTSLPTLISTNDGSYGIHGTVLTILEQQPLSFFTPLKQVFVCGPTRMMQACTQWFETHYPAVTVYVSLENHMPCGTGACYGCVVEQNENQPPVRVCLEGPVFPTKQLAGFYTN